MHANRREQKEASKAKKLKTKKHANTIHETVLLWEQLRPKQTTSKQKQDLVASILEKVSSIHTRGVAHVLHHADAMCRQLRKGAACSGRRASHAGLMQVLKQPLHAPAARSWLTTSWSWQITTAHHGSSSGASRRAQMLTALGWALRCARTLSLSASQSMAATLCRSSSHLLGKMKCQVRSCVCAY